MIFFRLYILFLFFILYQPLSAQSDHFEITGNQPQVSIPFHLVNNLIILETNINNTSLNLVFDTGVNKTMLINIAKIDSLSFKTSKKKNFTGAGIDQPVITGIVSKGNKIQLSNKIINKNAEIYIITGVEFSFLEHLGVNINGFIGGELIKDYIVQIDYNNKKLHFYKHSYFNKHKLKNNQTINLEVFNNKPYVTASVQTEKKSPPKKLKFLIDTGNSDALWIFKSKKFKLPAHIKTLKDYFGLGFSGEIDGLRFKMHRFSFNHKFSLKKIYTALPDTVFFQNIIKQYPFDGIIGSEILRRFHIYFDYKHQKLYLKKNRQTYHDKFLFNDVGLYLIYDGKIPVMTESLETKFEFSTNDNRQPELIYKKIKAFKYQKVDKIVIHYIRKNSPADRAGLMPGDVLLKINNQEVYKYNLDELEEKFFFHKSKHLKFLIERKGLILEFKVYNKSQL